MPTERQTQDAIVQALRLHGYEVLETGRWRTQVACPACGEFFTPHTGMPNTPGTPDLLVYVPQRRGWVGLEVKAPGGRDLFGAIPSGRVRAEQARLAAAAMTVIVRSVEEALAAVAATEGAVPGPGRS